MRDTSLDAFNELKASGSIGEKQGVVLLGFVENPDCTDKEISEILDLAINTVTPRRGELLDMDILEDAGTRKCSITGRTAHIWRVKTLDKNNVKKPEKKMRGICPMCKGSGYIIKSQTTLDGY